MGLKDASVFGKKKNTGLPETNLKTTRWSESAAKGETLKEYPRPSMKRDNWINLNGWWDYAITKYEEPLFRTNPGKAKAVMKKSCIHADVWEGKILVPFSPESELSGVHRQLQPDQSLWYHKTVEVPKLPENKHYLLHFGAVDQSCEVYVDGELAYEHTGGYLPFFLDLPKKSGISHNPESNTHTKEDSNTLGETNICYDLVIRVRDVSDTSYHSRGKQKLARGGMYYTAQSGIWQTVWMEPVTDRYIERVKIDADYDTGKVRIQKYIRELRFDHQEDSVDNSRSQQRVTSDPDAILKSSIQKETIRIEEIHPWSPEDPFLYQVKVSAGSTKSAKVMEDIPKVSVEDIAKASVEDTPKAIVKDIPKADIEDIDKEAVEDEVDEVECYFAFRKLEIKKDLHGYPRFWLNGRICIQTGVLDQGYWCDGLYTAPSDEALIYDIHAMKELGFNMIRKHIKIEPERWYYHCDRMGMLVWQDMVSGGTSYVDWFVTYLATAMNVYHLPFKDGPASRRLLSRKDKEGRDEFLKETDATIKHLYNHPSIVAWVPFNEGWGQFDAKEVAEFVRKKDKTRWIDHASGWYDQGAGDMVSLHHYFFGLHFKAEDRRVLALSEFGGYTWQVPGHSFAKELYGYGAYDSKEKLTDGFIELYKKEVLSNIKKGISAFVYTQLSDVEEEVNGMLTYDREIVKLDADKVFYMNEAVKNACM